MCNFNVDFSKIFWGHSPQTPILGRGYGAPPQTSPASALRRLRRFAPPRLARDLRSLRRGVPPYKNPGCAPDLECSIHLKVRLADGTLDVLMLWLSELTVLD